MWPSGCKWCARSSKQESGSPNHYFFWQTSDVFCSDAVLHLVISFAICQAGGKISLLSVFEFRLIFEFFEYQIMSLVRFSCTFGMQCKLNIQMFMWWPAHVQWGLELVPKNYGLCLFQFPKFYFFLLWSADLVIPSSPELFEFKCARDLLDKKDPCLAVLPLESSFQGVLDH